MTTPENIVPFTGLSRAAVRWFKRHQRDLPFRKTNDPYAILVSELMLQQTQVQTVLPYFVRFMQRFPDVASLARADENEVLGLWAGLGYYRRARLLQAAARAVMTEHRGVFPQSLSALESLPGVGRYTAGAVYSFAYNLPAPIVEANTARLLARLIALEVPVGSTEGARQLWATAEALLPARNPREHNYALMEIGALVCKPVPQCTRCPLAKWCRAYQEGRQLELPVAAKRPERLQRLFVCAVARDGERYLVRQIPEGEWHHGLFGFPAVPAPVDLPTDSQSALLRKILAPFGAVADLAPFARLQYTVTRHQVALEVYRCQLVPTAAPAAPFAWHTLPEIDVLPLSSPQRKLLDLVKANDEFFSSTP